MGILLFRGEKLMKQIDGPKTPRGWQLMQWIVHPLGFMEATAKSYGDIFATSVGVGGGSRPLVFVSNPEALKQILGNDTKDFFTPGKYNRLLAPILGTSAVFMLDGEQHRRRRKLLMPPFHGERLRMYGGLICELTEQVMAQKPLGKPFSVRAAMQEISMQVILQIVFGLRTGERKERLAQLLASLLNVFNSPLTSGLLFFPSLQKDWGRWSPWGYFRQIHQQIDDLVYAEIRERHQQNYAERTDILSLLMSVQDEDGEPLSDQQLRDELLTLLFAGHETTATAMAWSLYWIHHLPEIGEKLRQELADLGNDPNPLDIVRLPYLTAVCQETLRIYPVGMVTFVRTAKAPVEVMGYHITPEMNLIGCIYLTHHREELYPQPKRFKPDRFLGRQFSPYEFLPFGGGVRRCLGEALAWMEMKLVLATIATNYELKLADTKPETPQRRGITLAPTRGVQMILESNLKP